MKKSKRRNSSLKTRRRRRPQKMWNMRGCASKRNRICVKCHHKCNRSGMSSRKKRGGSPDAPFAFIGTGNVPNMPNPHYAYTGQGGGATSCQRGGNLQTMVGNPWGAQISQWPGVAGPHDGNYLAQNTYNIQPEMDPISERTTSGIMGGGRRRRPRQTGRKRTRRSMRGGDFGIFSQLGTEITNAYRGWNGEPDLANPLPFKDQMFYGKNAQDNLNYLKVG